ncbi:MAG: hypothetical protein ACH346_06410 [Chthoniobacterales bacterium]
MLLLLSITKLSAALAESQNADLLVTASDYCSFLNTAATSDPYHLYDEKMSTDPEAACLTRRGNPGDYVYQVVTGKERAPISFVSERAEQEYAAWKSVMLVAVTNGDQVIKCNNIFFPILAENTTSLTLITPEALLDKSEDAALVTTMIAAVAAMMLGGGGHEIERRTPGDRATLQHAEIAESLRVIAIQDPNASMHHYQEADSLWAQQQAAWEGRTVAQQEARSARELHAIAVDLCEKVREARENIDLEKTILGRLSKGSALAAKGLGFVPCPIPLAGAATTISEATGLINEVWEDFKVTRAEAVVAELLQKKERAAQQANAVNTKVVNLEREARQAEAAARVEARVRAQAEAESLKPPSTSLNVAAWKTWATTIVENRGPAPYFAQETRKQSLVEHGMKDPLWAANEAAAAWGARMEFSERNIRNQEAHTAALLHPHELLLQEAHEATTRTRRLAAHDQERLNAAMERHAEAREEVEVVNEELNELEKEPSRRGLEEKIEKKQQKFLVTFDSFETACRDLKLMREAALASNTASATAEERALPIRKNYHAAEKFLTRTLERLRVQAAADREAYKKIWPEHQPEVLRLLADTSSLSERGSEAEANEPPALYDADHEERGRGLLREKKQSPAMISDINQTAHSSSEENDLKPSAEESSEMKNFDLTFTGPVIPEIIEPTEADEARWKARKKADKLRSQAVKAAIDWAEDNNFAAYNNRESEAQSVASKQSVASTVASSIGSFVKSIFKPTTIAESCSEMDESSFGIPPLNGLEETDRLADEAEEEWNRLAEEAEAQRLSLGGLLFPTQQEMLSAWKRADRTAMEATTEQRRIEKEEAAEEQLTTTWEEDQKRWAALKAADDLAEIAKEAKVHYAKLVKKGDPSAKAAAKSALEEAKEKADAAKKEWYLLADREENIEALRKKSVKEKYHTFLQKRETAQPTSEPSSEEAKEAGISEIQKKERAEDPAVEAAKNELEAADRAVNQLLNRLLLKTTYQKNKEEELSPQGETEIASKHQQEAAAYRFDVITEKNAVLAQFFQEADAMKVQAQKAYGSADPNVRAQAEALYATVDELEEVAIQNYSAAARGHALQAAWKENPGVEAAWDYRIKQSLKMAQAAKERSGQTAEFWADDALRNALRYKEIARADVKALRAFHREAARLEMIETQWQSSMEAGERLAKREREQAAQDYHDGDSTRWDFLSSDQRATYHQEVQQENKRYYREQEALLTTAQQRFIRACHQWEQAWTLSAKKQQAFDVAQEAEKAVIKQIATEAERLVLIRWSQQEPEECTKSNFYKMLAAQKEQLKTMCLNDFTPEQHEVEQRFNIAKVKELKDKIAQLKSAEKKHDKNAAQARVARKTEDAESLSSACLGAFRASNRYAKAIEARAAGMIEKASAWEKAAHFSQQQMELYLKAIKARADGKKEDVVSFTNAAYGASWASARYAKAIEVRAAGKIERASAWEKAAHFSQQQMELHLKAIKARADGKSEEATAWEKAAHFSQQQMKLHLKAMEARAAGKTEDVESLELTARGAYLASDYYEKAIKARSAGKSEEAAAWEKAAHFSQQRMEFFLKAMEARAAGKTEDAESLELTARGAYLASDYYEKAIKARSAGKSEEAEAWEKAAHFSQQRMELLLKAIKARAAGKTEDVESLTSAGDGSSWASDYYERAIKARSAGKSEEAEAWEKAAHFSQQRIELLLKALKARADGKTEDAESLTNAGCGAYLASEFYEKAIKVRAAGKSEEAEAWEKAAYFSQQQMELFLKAMEARSAGKTEDAQSLTNAGCGAIWASVLYAEAIEARSVGKIEEAEALEKAAHFSQQRMELLLKAIEARADGKEKEALNWSNAGYTARWVSRYLAKALEQRATGNLERAALLEWVAGEYQHACETWQSAAEAQRPEEQKERHQQAWQFFHQGNERLLSFYEAKVRKTTGEEAAKEASHWQEVIHSIQFLIDRYQKTERAETTGTWKEVQSWRDSAEVTDYWYQALVNAIEEGSEESPEKRAAAAHWREVASEYQTSFEHLTQSAERYAAGEEAEGELLYKEGEEAFQRGYKREQEIKYK